MTVRSDGTLVLAVLDGDADAFGALVHRHQGAMFRYAVRMCGDRDDADDVVQSAFVRAYRNLAQCRERERFAAWVRQIVMNECRTLLATRGRRSRWFVTDEAVLAAVESPTTALTQRLVKEIGAGVASGILDEDKLAAAAVARSNLWPDLQAVARSAADARGLNNSIPSSKRPA